MSEYLFYQRVQFYAFILIYGDFMHIYLVLTSNIKLM